jgi:hypothetical protein
MAQTKIDGKFYPLQNDEWLKATQELRYAEIRVLYYLRTLDPFGQQDNRIKVTDIANIIGLKKGTVSKALCTLKEKDYIHLEVSEAIVSINSFPTRNLVSYKKPRFLQETSFPTGNTEAPQETLTHCRKPSRTVGNDQEREPASDNDSGPPKNNKNNKNNNISLSEEEREKFSAFCLEKARQLPSPPVLVEKWISKHREELEEAFKREYRPQTNQSKTTYTPEEIEALWTKRPNRKNSFSNQQINSGSVKKNTAPAVSTNVCKQMDSSTDVCEQMDSSTDVCEQMDSSTDEKETENTQHQENHS